MIKRVIKSFSIVALAAIVLQGCYPKEDLYYADLDVSVTHFDMAYDFSQNSGKVCVVIDSIAHYVDEDETPEGVYDDVIINQVLENLKNSTFEHVYLIKDSTDIIPGQEPNCVVTITAWETDYYNYYYYPWYDYWYWGWGWYYKSGSLKSNNEANYYYYPWYPWGGSWYYSYTTGTVLIDMVNADEIEKPENFGDEVKLPIIWTGALNGLVSGSKNDETNRIKNQIDQCFTQSPYFFE